MSVPQEANSSSNEEALQRGLVLTAALRVFSVEGFAGASVREIAALAECNHAMIRYYFGTKDALWRAAVEFLFERERAEMAITGELRGRLLKGERAAAEEWIRRYVAYCRRHPDHARIMVQASIRNDDRLAWAANEFINQKHRQVLPYIEALMKSGVLPRLDSTLNAGYILVAACQTLFMLAPEVEHIYGTQELREYEERHADAVVAMLLR
jgi:AcrR family transcriptional regulator